MKIAVIGVGNIGSTLAKKWATAGHSLALGVRDPQAEKYQTVLDSLNDGLNDSLNGEAHLTTPHQAAAQSELILLAIPGQAVPDFVAGAKDALAGKIIIDASNKVGQAPMNSLAVLAEATPTAHLYRAFNTLGWENFETPELNGQQIDLFYCGDEPAKDTVAQRIEDVGLRPVYIGGRDQVEVIDALTRLWFALAFGQGKGRRLAFKMEVA